MISFGHNSTFRVIFVPGFTAFDFAAQGNFREGTAS